MYRDWLKSSHELVASNNSEQNSLSVKKTQAVELDKKIKAHELGGDSINFKALVPEGGFYDKNVQRLLLKSNCTDYNDKALALYYLSS